MGKPNQSPCGHEPEALTTRPRLPTHFCPAHLPRKMSVLKKKKKNVCSFETAMCVTYCCGTGGLSSFVRTAPLFCFAALPPDLLLSCLIVKMFVLTIWHPLPQYYWNTVYERVPRMVVYLVMPTVLHLPPTDPDALVGSTAPFRFRVAYKATNRWTCANSI